MNITQTKLKNGLQILLINKPYLPTVTILFGTPYGSVDEKRGKNGIASLTRKMHLRGTKKYPNPQALHLEIEKLGARIYTNSAKEVSTFGITVPKQHLQNCISLLKDIILHPKDDIQQFTIEKQLLLDEVRELTDNPLSHLGILINKQLFKGTKLAHISLGNEKHIPIVLCGDFSNELSEEYVLSEMNKNFSFPLNKHKPIKVICRKSQKYLNYVKRPLHQPVFAICDYAPKYNSRDFYPYQLASIILGRGFGSKTMQIIREKYHLAYYARGFYNPMRTIGFGGIFAGVFSDKVVKAITLARQILIDMIDGKINKDELERAKGLFEGMLIGYNESSSDIASFYLEQKMFRNSIDTFREIQKQIQSISMNTIIDICKKYFSANPYLSLIAKEKPKGLSWNK